MNAIKLENSPIVYHISRCQSEKWIMLLHAAFVDHRMFAALIAEFQDKYNIIAVDILGHGESTQGRKGDSIDKMSGWMKEILLREKVSKDSGVPASLLTGATEEECKTQAEAIKAYAQPKGYPKVPDGGEVHNAPGAAATRDKFAEFMADKI